MRESRRFTGARLRPKSPVVKPICPCLIQRIWRWLVKRAAQFPRVVESAIAAREPHRIAFYLYDLASDLHALWNVGNDRSDRRFLIVDQPELTCARLSLVDAIGQIIRNGLRIMGVDAVLEMGA